MWNLALLTSKMSVLISSLLGSDSASIRSFLQLCSADSVSTEVALKQDQLLQVACAYQKAAWGKKLGEQITAV